ncbi:MAG: polysaccharide biosynthesis protein VpsM [Desulfobacteraceae bacterium Eth-SRB2]|nr:MAG: polysaccharide biosynthesis protein VpsM [Desulfobacteraceae bacterium Eth-SRB2]
MKNKQFATQGVIKTGLLICLTLFLWVPSVFAIGNIHLGRFEINPELSYKGEYKDNIYFESGHEDDDFIHTITPGIGLKISGTPGNFLSAGYKVGIVKYSDYDDNDYEDHRLFVSAGLKTPKGLYLRVQDSFQDTEDPFDSKEEFRLGVQTERWNNLVNIIAGYEFAGRYCIEATYSNFVERYDLLKDEFQDTIEHKYGLAVFYNLTPKTALFGQYLRNDTEYDAQNDGIDVNRDGFDEWNSENSQDYIIDNFLIGARFKPGGKLSGEFKLGLGTIDFDNDMDKNGNKYDDDSFFAMEAEVGYKPVEKTSLSLNLKRYKQASNSADFSGDVSATYLRTIIGLALTQNFTDRISAKLGFEWSNKDYLDERPGNAKKELDLYTARCGVDYSIRDWLSAGLSYKYQDNQASRSQYDDDEYTVNTVAFQITGKF